MDEVRARFNARVAMHVRAGWEVVAIHDQPGEPLAALLTIATMGRPRPPGRGVARQEGILTRYCRRIVIDHQGLVRVTNVACPPDLTAQRDDADRGS
jgi:hypothetical protein